MPADGAHKQPADVRQSCLVMTSRYLAPVLGWYREHARDLPWRDPAASAWSVMVSEIMLQQTPVSRVLPAHREWLPRAAPPAPPAAPPGRAGRRSARRGGAAVGAAGLPAPGPAAARGGPDRDRAARRGHPGL